MKKEIPNIIKLEIPYDPVSGEHFLLWRFMSMIKHGHAFAKHDFNLFCALQLRHFGLEKLSEGLKKYILDGDKIIPEVHFQLIAYSLEVGDEISDKDMKIHMIARHKRALKRLSHVKREIQRTGINSSKINLQNSTDYKILLDQVARFEDLTLVDWFVPIVLTFAKFVHIYIKHVEETKFGDGQFKRRSFIDYKHDELLTLIKQVLHVDEENIKSHFLEVRAFQIQKEYDKMKDYHRGFRHYPPIQMNGDNFRLSINGYFTHLDPPISL